LKTCQQQIFLDDFKEDAVDDLEEDEDSEENIGYDMGDYIP
jgi:hypothetical protein